jgi:uncharacterized protein
MLDWIVTAIGIGGVYSVFVERHWLAIRQVHVPTRHLPASFSGFKIALFSDIHLGFFYQPKQLAALVRRINELNPDVICFTGDLLDSSTGLKLLAPTVQLLAKLKAPYGKFGIVGNHDHFSGVKEIIEGLHQGGFTVLQNEHALIKKAEDRLFLIGLDDMLDGKPSIHKALKKIPLADCKILLVHEPDFAAFAPPVPIDLQLSGHSHGGQVRLAFFGPILTTKMGKIFTSGLNRGKHWLVYTNRGIGTTHLPIRFFCRPELTLITLDPSVSTHT